MVVAPPYTETTKISNWITEHEKRIARVENALSTAQLRYSSLDNTSIPMYDADGVYRGSVGMQNDGTVGAISVNNPVPPKVPNAPIVVPTKAGLSVSSTGSVDGSSWPADFSHLNVYSALAANPTVRTLEGTIVAANGLGSFIIAPLPYTSHVITLTSVNYSLKESGFSTPSSGTPLQVAGPDITANSIDTNQIIAGAITAAKLAADLVIATRIIAGTATGARVEMHPTAGLQAFLADGVTRTFWINAATGSAYFMGEIVTAPTGARIVMNPGGTFPAEARFYQGTTIYGSIYADPAPGGTAAIIIEGSGTNRGRSGVYPAEAFTSYYNGTTGKVPSATSCLFDRLNIWGGDVFIGGMDKYGAGEVIITYADGNDTQIASRTLYFRGGGGGEPALYSANFDTQIVWIGTGMIVQNAAGGGTKSFFNSSSRAQKKGEKPIQFGTRKALAVIGAVESKSWNYNDEWVEGEPVPLRRKIKQHLPEERDDNGRLIKGPSETLIDAPQAPKMNPHFGPIAEDILLVAPELVIQDPSIPGGLGLTDRDLIGVLWEALRELRALVKQYAPSVPIP
jgi:hypothetical protein